MRRVAIKRVADNTWSQKRVVVYLSCGHFVSIEGPRRVKEGEPAMACYTEAQLVNIAELAPGVETTCHACPDKHREPAPYQGFNII